MRFAVITEADNTTTAQTTHAALVERLGNVDTVTPGQVVTSQIVSEVGSHGQLTSVQAAQIAQDQAQSLVLGGYTILGRIGAGGMGQVFRAVHRRMDRVVAIKTLPADAYQDAAAIARFEREVRAAAKLEHPNIVTAYDADSDHGVHFLVMQYVEGKDLAEVVKEQGPLSPSLAAQYLLQAARGLEFAHSEGVIHRDIKPANLLLNKKGVVKILDLGLARVEGQNDVATQAELTGSGTVMGTIDYMAPEQALSTRNADARADVYSLGCTLFYLLTGQPTYGGETLTARLIAHQVQPIPELLQRCPNATPALEAVFRKMVAKKVEERYQSMSEVIADLEQFIAEQKSTPSTTASTTDNALHAELPGPVHDPLFAATVIITPVRPCQGSADRETIPCCKRVMVAALLGVMAFASTITARCLTANTVVTAASTEVSTRERSDRSSPPYEGGAGGVKAVSEGIVAVQSHNKLPNPLTVICHDNRRV